MNNKNQLKVIDSACCEDFKAESLQHMILLTRKRKRLKYITVSCYILCAFLSLSIVSTYVVSSYNQETSASVEFTKNSIQPSIPQLTNEEYLELFPNKPVALVITGDERKLILLDAIPMHYK